MSSVKSNGEHAPTAKYHRLLCFAVLAHWRHCDKAREEYADKGWMGVQWAAELLREALQVQQRALLECRHVWRCLCIKGVPRQNSGSFHAARFQHEPRPYA